MSELSAEEQFNLGIAYAYGEGVEQDYFEAVKWFKEAADQGDVEAQLNLGYLYASGDGVTQSYPEAAKWYRLAAEQGDVDAIKWLERLEMTND